jgi:hypothetical protein
VTQASSSLLTAKSLSPSPQVTTDKGVDGVLEGAFGKSGKFNVRFDGEVQPGDALVLRFKKFVHGDKGLMVQ